MTFTPKVLRRVTLPTLKLEIDKTVYVKITGPMHEGAAQKANRRGAEAGAEPRKPPTICDTINLENGEPSTLIVAAVVKGIFDDNYTGDAYVGKCFGITKHEKVRGKDYYPYDVVEVEDPAAPAELSHAASKRGR